MNCLEGINEGSVIMITTDINDFNFYHPKFKCFLNGFKLGFKYFFKVLECKFLITTLLDIGNNFEKSKNCEKCVYFYHAFSSVHKTYTKTAFENYDIIFTNGHYQKKSWSLLRRNMNYNYRIL